MLIHQMQISYPSRNGKTGPIAVSTTSEETCPEACSLKNAGCYADNGPLALFWRKVTERKAGAAWNDAIAKIKALPKGIMFRHNQAGDLPGQGNAIDGEKLRQLVNAARGKIAFTYTHKPMTQENIALVREANEAGFTINLSAETVAQADELAALGIAPIALVLPSDQTKAFRTPEGRLVGICPATISDKVTCATCGLCAQANRKAIIGFPAHGARRKKASAIAQGEAA